MWGPAQVVQVHGILSPGSVRLEEHCLLVAALLAAVVLGSRQRLVLGHVSDVLGQLCYFADVDDASFFFSGW